MIKMNSTESTNNIEYFIINKYTKNITLPDNNLNILYLNAGSLINKLGNFEQYLTNFKIQFDVIVIVEFWLNYGDEKFYNLNNYNAYFNIREHRKGGSSAIYVCNKLQSELVFNSSEHEIEITIVKLKLSNTHKGGIYRPPINSNFLIDNFCDQLSQLNKFKNLITLGDININLLENDFKCINT